MTERMVGNRISVIFNQALTPEKAAIAIKSTDSNTTNVDFLNVLKSVTEIRLESEPKRAKIDLK